MKALCIGECMVEISLGQSAALSRGYGGDTLNTAVYLSRLGWRAGYATAIGAGDPFSEDLVALMIREGVSTELVARVPGRLPGLYAIVVDPAGERRFYYWRREAPVRQLFRHLDQRRLETTARAADLVYLSGISLAVLAAPGRAKLTGLVRSIAEAGVRVALDVNYRAALWRDASHARRSLDALAPCCSYISLGESEANELYDCPGSDLAQRWAARQAEVVLRGAKNEVFIYNASGMRAFPSEPPVAPVDTTGAGDAFNAAYLAERVTGRDQATAVREARRLAAAVVLWRGAILPIEHMPPRG